MLPMNDDKNDANGSDAGSSEVRKDYRSPELTEYGDIHVLTQQTAKPGPLDDGGGASRAFSF